MIGWISKNAFPGIFLVGKTKTGFSLAPSLGGVESLATQPATTTHHGMGPAERARGAVRLSIGEPTRSTDVEIAARLLIDAWRELGA